MTGQVDLKTVFEHYQRTQWFAEREIENYQAVLLTQLVRHSYDTVPFYRERLKPLVTRRGNIDLTHWNKVPILERDELQLHGLDLISRAIPPDHGKLYKVSTSGSTTGKSVSVTATEHAAKVRTAVLWRTDTWHNIDWSKQFGAAKLRRPGAALWPDGGRDLSPWGPTWLTTNGPPGIFIAGHTPIDKLAEWIGRNHVRYFAALPLTLAALAEEPAARHLPIEAFISFGMRVKPEHRTVVRDTFGAGIVELYGSEDCGPMASGCEAGSLHVMSELVRLEIVDDNGDPCPLGTAGRVLITVLHNAAQPLIRYAVGDVASFGPPCSCGRALPVIESIPGRQRDLFRRPDGSRFVAHTIAGLFPAHTGVKWWQIAQTGPDNVEVRVIAPALFGAADRTHVAVTLREAWNWNCQINFKQLKGIPYGPGRKQSDFVNECRSS